MIYIKRASDYLNWFDNLNTKEQAQVKARMERIAIHEHFGDVKNLGEGLAELRWKNGWRVYFSNIGYKKIILLIGGHKNEQEKNIKKARLCIRRFTAH